MALSFYSSLSLACQFTVNRPFCAAIPSSLLPPLNSKNRSQGFFIHLGGGVGLGMSLFVLGVVVLGTTAGRLVVVRVVVLLVVAAVGLLVVLLVVVVVIVLAVLLW